MGQKIHPLGFRLNTTQTHRSQWFSKPKNYPRLLLEDRKLRQYILTKFSDQKKYGLVYIGDIFIERRCTMYNLRTKETMDWAQITIHTPSPRSIVPGYSAADTIKNLKQLQAELETMDKDRLSKDLPPLRICVRVLKIRVPKTNASMLAQELAKKLEDRAPFRSTLKKALTWAKKEKIQGIKIQISGRLNGAEIARTEWVRHGRVPLQTLRANVDYCYKTAKTTHGILGIKIWTFQE